ncbi:hypothetical protein ABZ348_19245 [Streptomyces sp. NPDC005963]|uniref:hypothetical protein n=1 Tax=Streptomyces sp. NPDC005963 TaxID=3156721 RepID=UPI0033C2F475
MTATRGTTILSVVLLVPFHFTVRHSWQDRWPPQLLAQYGSVLSQESRDGVPLARIPRGNEGG